MKRTVIGILAHVDAGKTTLSEAMLYTAGAIRSPGRVDHGDAFLDHFELERQRGITIFSKQALLEYGDMRAALLDTPGHADFAAETERVLDVLDCAVLVLSGPAGVQSHTRTLWRLLRSRRIPTFLFINKMDQPGADRAAALRSLERLEGAFVPMDEFDPESAAMCDEALLEELLDTGSLSDGSLADAIRRCAFSPCWFGSALKMQGVEAFLRALARFAPGFTGGAETAAKVYKITHDDRGARLTHLKVTGGVLRVRDMISGEKITQIRVYSGARFTQAEEAVPGDVVAVTGLTKPKAGSGLGAEPDSPGAVLEPVLTYTVLLPEGCDAHRAAMQLAQLNEEDPQLHLIWSEASQTVSVQLMGQVQLEVLRQTALDRWGLEIGFGAGRILYRETIRNTVEGVGHYEPLRHYAEVHLILSPGEPGSGITVSSQCSEDVLDRNWQRLILTHVLERQHAGVLTGSPVTDVHISLAAGRAHPKHTEGGDFRQATYRAIRQGLMQADNVLLEPWYDIRLELPQSTVGRAVTDLGQMGADTAQPETDGETAVITGRVPVASLGDYHREFTAYTHGEGRLYCSPGGYAPCRDQESAVASAGYDPEADVENPPDSVFCAHGAGYIVKWYDVPSMMHIPSVLHPEKPREEAPAPRRRVDAAVSDDELMAIFERTYGPIRHDRGRAMRPREKRGDAPASRPPRPRQGDGMEYVLVDGYNIIFAWEELKKLSETDLDAARARLINIMRNYQGFRQCPVILVFDAYKVKDGTGSMEKLGGLTVVYTKEAETADMYIEKAAYDLGKKHSVRVATSDRMEQLIILGSGALRVPADAFKAEVDGVLRDIRAFLEKTWQPDPLPPVQNPVTHRKKDVE